MALFDQDAIAYMAAKEENKQLRAQLKEAQAEAAHWKNNHETEVRRARILKERTDMPIERVDAYEQWGKDQVALKEAELAEGRAKTRAMRLEMELAASQAREPVEVDLFGAALVDTDTAEAVMFYSPDMFPDMATIKDRFELVKVYTAPPDYEEIKRQRDELAKALISLKEAVEFTPLGVRGIKAVANARSALASVKGETK